MNETAIPMDGIINGNSIASFVWIISLEVAPITKAAQIDSASDPNKSDPVPEISPTLSPTLLAITPGLDGSSSFNPYTTFQAKSEPISAAFV